MSYKQETTVYSVEERLPENGKLVRAYALREGPGAEWGWESVWYDAVNACWRSFHHRFHVTHWHEMPGPPRECCSKCEGIGILYSVAHGPFYLDGEGAHRLRRLQGRGQHAHRGWVMIIDITKAQAEWLAYVLEGSRQGFAAMFSGEQMDDSVAVNLVDMGILSTTQAVRCDGDGYPEGYCEGKPEEWGEAYKLTELGQAMALLLEKMSEKGSIGGGS